MHCHLRHYTLYVVAIILGGLLSVVACDSSSRRAAMLAVLDEADSLNRNYIPITSDSLLLEATGYFDSHGTPNERLRAHYLLGCAYRDMEEAPRAIECFLDAIAKADTVGNDCNYHVLACVYAQLANIYHQLLLFSQEIEARRLSAYYEKLSGNIYFALYENKMSAGAYILLNKEDSAEILLQNVIRLYRENGYEQDAIQASNMLLYIYINHSNHLPEVRNLINQYEEKSNHFDEFHELHGTFKQFYYYKGMYYERVHQLDSAELYYRKICHPEMGITSESSMYKGLLSVFTKLHQADSIAKYAQLYCTTNDSSIAIKDQERTAQMATSYNYNRYQKQALDNARTANQRLYIVVALLSVVILGIITAFFFYQQYKRKKKVLEELEREYEEAQNNFVRIKRQLQQLDEKYKDVLNSLQKEDTESQAIITKLNDQHEAEKEQLTQELHSYTERVELLERQLKISQYARASLPFLNLGIVRRIKLYAEDGRRQLSENDLNTLADAVKEHFPDLTTDLEGAPAITPLAKNVCLLAMLNLKPGEIVNLLGISSSQVSNLRKDINATLFHENTTRTLYQNLSQRYKILSS